MPFVAFLNLNIMYEWNLHAADLSFCFRFFLPNQLHKSSDHSLQPAPLNPGVTTGDSRLLTSCSVHCPLTSSTLTFAIANTVDLNGKPEG